MKWRGRRTSSNVRDMRGRGGLGGGLGGRMGRGGGLGGGLGSILRGGRRGGGVRLPGGLGRGGFGRGGRIPLGTRRGGGGLSFGMIALLVIGFLVLRSCGIDPLGGATGNGPVVVGDSPRFEPQVPDAFRRDGTRIGTRTTDEMGEFIGVVLADTEDIWSGIFEAEGLRYQEPQLVLFEDTVTSACGSATSASGPFYCPGDNQLYLDTSFFDTLANRFGAYGDFAQAYVIAHEVGHHVQNLTGVLPEFNRMRRSLSQRDENALSVRVELQADCYAGIWAHYQARNGYLDDGDIEEAANAAVQIGDDTLQERSGRVARPETFSHGTSEQRRSWFLRGYQTGRTDSCDTFASNV